MFTPVMLQMLNQVKMLLDVYCLALCLWRRIGGSATCFVHLVYILYLGLAFHDVDKLIFVFVSHDTVFLMCCRLNITWKCLLYL